MTHVIEPPKPEDFKRVKCKSCLALIGYTPNEIKKYSGTDYGGGPDGREWIICPNSGCGKDITLKSW